MRSSQRFCAAATVAWLSALATACVTHDLGTDCPEMQTYTPPGDAEGGGTVSGDRAVEINPQFPCESAVCVATPARGAYCSRPCSDSVGCPSGFACETILDIGEHRDDTYCVWASCNSKDDCGSKDMTCRNDAHPLASGQGVCDWDD